MRDLDRLTNATRLPVIISARCSTAYFAPLPILCLGVFVSIVQTLVFVLLSILYFSGAMEHAH